MKITKLVPRIIFGEGNFRELENILNQLLPPQNGYLVYLIDSVHQKTGLRNKLKVGGEDLIIDVDVSDHEPKTGQVDEIKEKILLEKNNEIAAAIIGIGGGSVMDITKAISVLMTNKGSAADYQGFDLVKEKAVFKIGIPTISGTGAEASRTAVLTSPEKKLGINSDESMFDAIILDPELIRTVDPQQEFYTGMDCFIHAAESLTGSFIDEFGRVLASNSKRMVTDFFLKEKKYDQLMLASYLGGCSIANSEVGVCHALSYGLSLVLGFRHGMACSVAFNQLDEFYKDDVKLFREIMEKNNIKLPENVTKDVTSEMMEKMVQMTLRMERPLTNALGENWRNVLTREKIIELYKKM